MDRRRIFVSSKVTSRLPQVIATQSEVIYSLLIKYLLVGIDVRSLSASLYSLYIH